MSLNIKSHQHENDVTVIDIQGEITFENSDELRDVIDQLIENNQIRIVVDLAQLKYMSSAGMGVLVHGLKSSRSKGGDLRLINLGAKMRRVFLITQFTHQFMVYNDLTEAVNSFKTDAKQVI
ncbi:MAG: anti-sigma factor antagonist [Clostridiales bacterium]|jgi:anti-sigma B factor antagonist|nr:anti-sigma factor antagonist [Clostridiales bacterium]MDN5283721.1 anti-sigma factor antagonist [Candidatus Ozemobacter sp.]